MTYNVHVFTHAEIIRRKGPFPALSTFPFEDHYSSYKKWYADGTFNQPKQIMYNIYTALLSKKCDCKRYIKYSGSEREATDDTRIYLFSEGIYHLFKLVEVGENTVSGVQINTLPWEPLLRVPDFRAVGVFETDGLKDEVKQIEKSQIAGKVMMVGTIAVTIPLIVLEEATLTKK